VEGTSKLQRPKKGESARYLGTPKNICSDRRKLANADRMRICPRKMEREGSYLSLKDRPSAHRGGKIKKKTIRRARWEVARGNLSKSQLGRLKTLH